MKLTILALLATFAFATLANAAPKQTISCKEVDGKHKYIVSFNPEAEQKEKWTREGIETYSLGKRNTKTTTTARAQLIYPNGEKEKLVRYYQVNQLEEKDGGYTDRFNGETLRSFSGTGSEESHITMYLGESQIGKNDKDFKALVLYQWAMMDQGYYHIDMRCTSKVTGL